MYKHKNINVYKSINASFIKTNNSLFFFVKIKKKD